MLCLVSVHLQDTIMLFPTTAHSTKRKNQNTELKNKNTGKKQLTWWGITSLFFFFYLFVFFTWSRWEITGCNFLSAEQPLIKTGSMFMPHTEAAVLCLCTQDHVQITIVIREHTVPSVSSPIITLMLPLTGFRIPTSRLNVLRWRKCTTWSWWLHDHVTFKPNKIQKGTSWLTSRLGIPHRVTVPQRRFNRNGGKMCTMFFPFSVKLPLSADLNKSRGKKLKSFKYNIYWFYTIFTFSITWPLLPYVPNTKYVLYIKCIIM